MPTLTEIKIASVSEFHFEQDHIMCGNVGIPGPMLRYIEKILMEQSTLVLSTASC